MCRVQACTEACGGAQPFLRTNQTPHGQITCGQCVSYTHVQRNETQVKLTHLPDTQQQQRGGSTCSLRSGARDPPPRPREAAGGALTPLPASP